MDAKWATLSVAMLIAGPPVYAYDVNESLSVGVTIAGALQCQRPSGGDADEECRGAAPVQPELSFRPSATDELFFKLGFAAGNALNETSPFLLAPWAAYLKDDVKNLNGRNRDHLLVARYRHAFWSGDGAFAATVGILDSTDYLDGNEYANDEYTQFMNEAFVNSGGYNLPSYDAGAALEWDDGGWSANGMAMSIGENDDGNHFGFWGVQAARRVQTTMGTGNYRVLLAGTTGQFVDAPGTDKKRRLGWGVSFDQAFGETVGGFLRLTWQTGRAAVDYKSIYSGGLNLSGSKWGRPPDNVGIGYAYLDGGNLDVERTQVAEVYYRFAVNDYLSLTSDVQYMADDYRNAPTIRGWVVGLRATAMF